MVEKQPDYQIIRDFNELRVEPIEVPMDKNVWYHLPHVGQAMLRMRQNVDQRIDGAFRRGRR